MKALESDVLKIIITGKAKKQTNIKTSKEIADKFERFWNWHFSVKYHFGRIEGVDPPLFVNFDEGSKQKYTLSDLYQYFLDNVDK